MQSTPTLDYVAYRSTALVNAMTLVAMTHLALPTSAVIPSATPEPISVADDSIWAGYYPATDKSVGCPDFPVRETDVVIERGNTLRLTADPKVGGVYLGAIAAKEQEFTNNSAYIFTGQFRKPHGNPEHIAVNLQYVDENYNEYYAEVIWGLNPYSPLYGWVWTRNKLDEQILLAHIGDDTNWHRFGLVVYHGQVHQIKTIVIDHNEFTIDLPMGKFEQKYNNYFAVLLEVQNMYTNCDPQIATTGTSEWREITLQTCEVSECVLLARPADTLFP
jgi:hypothetical protein